MLLNVRISGGIKTTSARTGQEDKETYVGSSSSATAAVIIKKKEWMSNKELFKESNLNTT